MKNNQLLKLFYASTFLLILLSCQKSFDVQKKGGGTATESVIPLVSGKYCYSCGIIDSMPPIDHGGDTTDLPTILGLQHVNPYLIPNIQRAYANLGITGVTVNITNLYVRFLPNSASQLASLDSIMNLQGLDLFEAPMDYDVTQEGDYYQDPSIPIEQVTYQYAVVPPTFQFPASITYTILAQIHIPPDNYQSVESEAERLASIQDSLNANGALSLTVHPETTDCGTGCHWDFNLRACSCCPSGYIWNGSQCVIPTCSSGYYWNGSACVPSGPPPPPPADAAIPAGLITLSDVNLGSTPGLRTARVVAKRWFKIQRLYTDNTGHFTCTKKFKHKVKIVIKFLNDFADIKGIRGFRIWQAYLPISKVIGVYSGNKSNIVYNFARNTAGVNITKNIGNRFWVGATMHNSVQEHRDYATQFGFALPPNGLTIMINNWGITSGNSSAPLFKKRGGAMNNNFISIFIGNGGALSPFNIPNIDILVDYYITDPNNIYSPFSSNELKETVYHELTHASEYSQTGSNWYQDFFNSEVAEQGHWVFNSKYLPYGDGTTANSPIIAVAESMAYHMGHFLAGTRYGNSGDPYRVAQKGGSIGRDFDILESFNPHLSGDVFNWIPIGLMEDLLDNTPSETIVNDQVSGYTTQQIFNSLQSDVTRMSDYKAKLLLLYGTTQQSQVTNLFASYGY